MPCLQSSTPPAGSPLSGQTPASGGYATEADCLQACKEGACCEGTTCTVKPQCQCQGAGKVFKGVGTVCESIKGACCDGDECKIVSECECQPSPQKTWLGSGRTCESSQCPKCGWIWKLPSVVTVRLSNCIDNAHNTDFSSMNGTYLLPIDSTVRPGGFGRQVNHIGGFATYKYVPAAGKQVVAIIDCNANGRVRYSAFAGTQYIYGVDGNAFGEFLDSSNKCFTASFSGGNQQFVSCSFEVVCNNPLP
jgi:hypothetical protein